VPLLVKIATDLSNDEVRDIAEMVNEPEIAGIGAVNTTIKHDYAVGGMSGKPIKPMGLEVVLLLPEHLTPQPTLIGVGGISNEEDARMYLEAGADLVQGYSAFIYEGPAWPSHLSRSSSA